ncbi:hypothetical protein ANRL4_02292 [Anaerolineae bacterium]|nr:hypothetical protein ANRL4_02292 [Anaerolineae bacterium]
MFTRNPPGEKEMTLERLYLNCATASMDMLTAFDSTKIRGLLTSVFENG